jgi:hypothetical protein
MLSTRAFAWRMFLWIATIFALVQINLLIGVLGYRYIAGFGWIDSLLNASMILGGMGPVGELKSDGAKVFASIYALFAGIVFIGVLGTLLAPFVHRLMHRFHIDEAGE